MKYPKKGDIEKVVNSLSDDDFSLVLPKNASKIDRTKYELCRKFVNYIKLEKISQAELARELRVDRSRINWIVKYRIEHFTIDRLYELWSAIEPSFELKVS
jgi:predicted XRE-type DNA-binding protein